MFTFRWIITDAHHDNHNLFSTLNSGNIFSFMSVASDFMLAQWKLLIAMNGQSYPSNLATLKELVK